MAKEEKEDTIKEISFSSQDRFDEKEVLNEEEYKLETKEDYENHPQIIEAKEEQKERLLEKTIGKIMGNVELQENKMNPKDDIPTEVLNVRQKNNETNEQSSALYFNEEEITQKDLEDIEKILEVKTINNKKENIEEVLEDVGPTLKSLLEKKSLIKPENIGLELTLKSGNEKNIKEKATKMLKEDFKIEPSLLDVYEEDLSQLENKNVSQIISLTLLYSLKKRVSFFKNAIKRRDLKQEIDKIKSQTKELNTKFYMIKADKVKSRGNHPDVFIIRSDEDNPAFLIENGGKSIEPKLDNNGYVTFLDLQKDNNGVSKALILNDNMKEFKSISEMAIDLGMTVNEFIETFLIEENKMKLLKRKEKQQTQTQTQKRVIAPTINLGQP